MQQYKSAAHYAAVKAAQRGQVRPRSAEEAESLRRGAHALRNMTPDEINRRHMEGMASRQAAEERAENHIRKEIVKETVAEMKREGH